MAGLPDKGTWLFFIGALKADVRDIKHDVLDVKLFFAKTENRHSASER
jgi:hypothetical protein